jgi:2-dehydro-3-deoxyphosphogluconate aldolase/(4S)-4-hydroxy-2-oxoglutarate aldolase
MNEVLELIGSLGIIPAVAAENPADAAALLAALSNGGLPVAQFEFRTPAAADVIRAAATTAPGALVGASAVITPQQVDAAVDAGARFVVSPGLDEAVVARARDRGIVALPGCATTTDVTRALQLGLDTVEFFPAEAAGGIALLRALAAQFPGFRFVPDGGIDIATMGGYLADRHVLAVCGSWFVGPDLLRTRDWSAITTSTREAVLAAHHFALAHVGVSTADAADAEAVADRFEALFGFDVNVGNSSIFASSRIEVVKGRSRGELGHLAIRTVSIPRAVAYLARNGFAVDPASEKRGTDGSLKAIYLVDEVAGFALHLFQEN